MSNPEDKSGRGTITLSVASRLSDVVDNDNVKLTIEHPTLLRHNSKDGNMFLLGEADRFAFPGDLVFFIGEVIDGKKPIWRERPPKVITIRHGTGNIRTSDGKDRRLVEGQKEIKAICHETPEGEKFWEVQDPPEEIQDTSRQQGEGFYDLSDHTTHKNAIADMAITYAQMEEAMSTLLTWMMQAPPQHAHAAFYALVNNKARTDMLRELVTWQHNEGERQIARYLIEKIELTASIRNKYCHALWKRKGDTAYIVDAHSSRFPVGDVKRPVSDDAISNDAATVRRNSQELRKIAGLLTAYRPVVIYRQSLKPSYAQKFLGQFGDHGGANDPDPQSKSEGS